MKIRDRVLLGMIAGFAGNIVKTAVDELSIRKKVSQRSFRQTAAGMLVSSKKEASDIKGQILGELFDVGMSSLGGVGIVYLMSKTGRDHVIPKGILSGIGLGSLITLLVNAFPGNRVKPKDAASNLSYMLSHALYGVVTTGVVVKAGHPSLFDEIQFYDDMEPAQLSAEEWKRRRVAQTNRLRHRTH